MNILVVFEAILFPLVVGGFILVMVLARRANAREKQSAEEAKSKEE